METPCVQPSIAVIGPKFFSYMDEIVAAFGQRGLRVAFWDERHSNSIPAKIGYRTGILNRLPTIKRKHLGELSRRIIQGGFTDALLIDTEVCDRPFVERLRSCGVRTHLYMWDSSRNKPTFLNYLDQLQTKMTFDPVDSCRHGMIYEPLFAASDYSATDADAPGQKSTHLYFCGTLHSNRAKWIVDTTSLAEVQNIKFSCRLFYHSRALLVLKGLVQPANLRLWSRTSTTGWSRQLIAHESRQAVAVLDVPHPGQNGLTIRTFEALQAGAALITTNEHAQSLPHRLAERVLIIRDARDIGEIDFSALAQLSPLSAEQRYFLSVDRFVDNILSYTGIAALISGSGIGK